MKSLILIFFLVLNNPAFSEGDAQFNCVSEIYLPENYTVSGDAVNEPLVPRIVGEPLNYSFRIFNRWGKAIFETTDIHSGWNGTFDKKPVEPNVYSWTISYSCEGSEEGYKISGTVTVFN